MRAKTLTAPSRTEPRAPRSARPRSRPRPREDHPFRMRDLCEQTGLPRQVIHFYISQGLVPEGKKTGRNMAYYGQVHLERIRLIRKLQEERFLPLRAIRAILDAYGDLASFSPPQRALLYEVKDQLGSSLGRPAGPTETVEALPLLARLGIDGLDLEELHEAGLLERAGDGHGGATKQPMVRASDVWLLELWAELRRVGFSRELGFSARDFAMYEEAISTLFRKEMAILLPRLSGVPAKDVARMIEQALPLISTLLHRTHEAKLRDFLTAL